MTGLENLHLNLRSERVKENGWDSANTSNQKKRDVFFFFFNITEPQTLTRRFVSTFLTKPFGIFPRPDLLHCEFYDLTSKHFPCVFSHIFIYYLAVCGVRPYWPTIAHQVDCSHAQQFDSSLLKGSSSSSYEKKISFFQLRSQWWMLLERNKLRLAPAPSPQNTSHE